MYKYDGDKRKIIDRYNERLKKYGADIRALAVGNMERQIVRYEILSQIGDLNNCSVLDVGCGFGDFYGFLLSKRLKVKYTGYDMNPNLIEIAKIKYPSAKFEVKDFFSEDINEKFDYVISSSAFNNKLKYMDNYTLIKTVIKKSFDICQIGVAINMMTNYVDYRSEDIFYYSPERIFRYCKKIANRVVLRHDYCLYEFTVYLYKEDCEWIIRQKEKKF